MSDQTRGANHIATALDESPEFESMGLAGKTL
jgi:hypothetical protein